MGIHTTCALVRSDLLLGRSYRALLQQQKLKSSVNLAETEYLPLLCSPAQTPSSELRVYSSTIASRLTI